MIKALILKKKPGNMWYLVARETGIIITGPHRWGTQSQALRAAAAFASTWNAQIVLEDEVGQCGDKNADDGRAEQQS